jgi:hypothetical protein
MNRRQLLAAGAAFVATGPLRVDGSPVISPSFEDLTRYYAFLWKELLALSAELGVDTCDNYTTTRNGDGAALGLALTAPPSTRCLAVLNAAGVDRQRLTSHPVRHPPLVIRDGRS